MRRLQKKARERARAKTREPLAEGIVPLNKRGTRDWKSMSDEELVAFAKKFVKENRINGRKELQKANSGLYKALRRRKLLDMVGSDEKQRSWSSLSDAQLVKHARQIMEERGISGRSELEKAARGLYHVLWKRKLLDMVGFEEKKRDWKSLSDAQLIEYTKKSMEETRISNRTELYKADGGLYSVLRKRKLLDKVGFEEIRRYWSSFSDAELVEHVRQLMEEKGINGRLELTKADNGLYIALQRRKLLDRIGFDDKRRKERPWKDVDNDELVNFTKKFMKKKAISGRSELSKADRGLYEALRKRKLLERVGFEEKLRNWSSFSDAQLVEHARQFMEENGIRGRKELAKTDKGLYSVLLGRKLLDRVFADIEQAKEKEEIQQIVEGLREFSV